MTLLMMNPANRRLLVLARILSQPIVKSNLCNCGLSCFRKYSKGTNSEYVTIGEVKMETKEPAHPGFVPRKYLRKQGVDQETLHHLRWMLQKDKLGQDMFLIGRPGPLKRRLAMAYLELTRREVEFVSLSRDTTEADLKQRREIRGGTAHYVDQGAVRAAIAGRVLILEGIEKAERNVLPVLNNLLENREMHFEDGRFLVPASRYDQLVQEHGQDEVDRWKLVRASEDFRVIALGIPVPNYHGNPLDPPLRSRFQARDVSSPTYKDSEMALRESYPDLDGDKLSALLNCSYALISRESAAIGLPDFPLDKIAVAAQLMNNFPWLPVYDVFRRLYPADSFLNKEGRQAVRDVLKSFVQVNEQQTFYKLERFSTEVLPTGDKQASVTLSDGQHGNQSTIPVRCGSGSSAAETSDCIATAYQDAALAALLQTHSVHDACLVGPKGCGKSMLVSRLANLLGYSIEPIVLYQDMTSRDLIQQRSTLSNGDTIWKNAPLVTAALEGSLAVLDGIHRLHHSTLAILHRLVHDRELQLFDGSRMLSHDRYDELVAALGIDQVRKEGLLRIHPSFRILALGEPSGAGEHQWLSPEILSLFVFHEIRSLTIEEEKIIITARYGRLTKTMQDVLRISDQLRSSSDPTMQLLASSLSTRQLLRIAHRDSLFPTNNPFELIQQAMLSKFLPALARNALDTVLKRGGLQPQSPKKTFFQKSDNSTISTLENNRVQIGSTVIDKFKTESTSKVPNVLFYDVPQHVKLLERLAQDFVLGEHLLLVGNQGVGKNKLVDRLLNLLNRPREYIQLHRDTTVQALTLRQSVEGGRVTYEDSPLVQAVRQGHVLVVDEADKAPTHVTCILKTLVENGEMVLSDGRRISRVGAEGGGEKIIRVHPEFRMIVLANRPGFPFLGNDFFAALGDLFSCHAVDNPTAESEAQLLGNYGPDVDKQLIERLVKAFGQLRDLADRGLLAYPYSTREIVNIVKHLQAYPNDTVANAVGNVFDFDRYGHDVKDTLLQVLNEHKIPVALTPHATRQGRSEIQMTVQRESGLDVSGPKHGKVDEKGDPHVGGNQWAGGTGGRDTAGLGGKGGPYRLDAGHTVHQLSDEEKASVPEHVRKAAHEMGQKAFKQRLKEIEMSDYDAKLYDQFYSSVAKQIQSLRVILSNVQAKTKERQWARHQTSGELDDAKLVEGIAGDRNIYRLRAEQQPEPGSPQLQPKRLRLVVDVSGSMYRFNGFDGRLDRQLEAVVLLTEALQGYEAKFRYDIVGHSGEDDHIPFVHVSNPPINNKQRLDVIKTMHAHAQFCLAGDHTLEATRRAIDGLAGEGDYDQAIVILLSDANLSRYAIPAAELSRALDSNSKVQAYILFIGSLGDQAKRLVDALPAGRGYLCMDVAEIPQTLQQIFTASLLSSR